MPIEGNVSRKWTFFCWWK